MRRFLTLLVLAASLACGDEPTSAKDAGINGQYFLRTINGVPIPYTIVNDSSTITISTDVIEIAEWGVWTEAQDYSVDGQRRHGGDAGMVIINGISITLMSGAGGVAYSGTFSGKTLMLSHGPNAYAFVR